MNMMKHISLSSALALLSLTHACDRQENSKLDIIRGKPLAPDSPALNNVVGLSRNGVRTFCTGSVSAHELLHKAEVNPDRSESPFVVKGKERAADVQEPQTWAEWIQYPYHNEKVWSTVQQLIFDLWKKQRPLLKDDEHVKIWSDPEFSQARMQEITSYELTQNVQDELNYDDQPRDLRPQGTWTGLEEVNLIGESVTLGLEAVSRLPALRKLTLNPGTWRPEGSLNLKSLQNLGESLNQLTLNDFKPTELKPLPFGALKQLQSLQVLAQRGYDEVALDMSGLVSLKELKISSWPYASKITLPKDLALETLELKLDHTTDLKWLDVEALKRIRTLEIGSEVLDDPAVMSLFQKKGIQKLVVPGSRLTSEHLPAAGFAAVQELVLYGNHLSSTAFMKGFPSLKTADLRDNPLSATECPAGISCSFDRIPNPKNVAEFCSNTIDSQDYAYASIIQRLLVSQGLSSSFYSDLTCQALQRNLDSTTALEFDGMFSWYLSNG